MEYKHRNFLQNAGCKIGGKFLKKITLFTCIFTISNVH
jgi:hypothetical protein